MSQIASTPSRKQPKLVYIGVTRLHYDSQNRLRSYNPVMSLEEWAPFLEHFSEITILARVDANIIEDDGYLLSDSRIKVAPIPYYNGLVDFYRKRREIFKFASSYITDPTAVFCTWAPNPLALYVARKAKRIGAPLITRVIGDTAGVAKALLPTPFSHFAALWSEQKARHTIRLSDAVIYVTLRSLQTKYPPNTNALVLARTNMQFTPELVAIPQKWAPKSLENDKYSLIAVGSQQQNYKGHDLLIEAVRQLQQESYEISLTLVGSGRLHEELKTQARESGATDIEYIERLGTSTDVARHVSKFDLFVMPSRTEGMPKAILEAMTVGVLSIGSDVGGIPEVLEPQCVFAPNSVPSLKETIQTMFHDISLRTEQQQMQSEKIEKIQENHSGQVLLTEFLKRFVDEKVETT